MEHDRSSHRRHVRALPPLLWPPSLHERRGSAVRRRDRRSADRAANGRNRRRRTAASRRITSSSRFATISGPATRPATASSRRCSHSFIRSRRRSRRWVSSCGRWSSSRRTTRWRPRRGLPPKIGASRRSASGRSTRTSRSACATIAWCRSTGAEDVRRGGCAREVRRRTRVDSRLPRARRRRGGRLPRHSRNRRGDRGAATESARSNRSFPPEVLGAIIARPRCCSRSSRRCGPMRHSSTTSTSCAGADPPRIRCVDRTNGSAAPACARGEGRQDCGVARLMPGPASVFRTMSGPPRASGKMPRTERWPSGLRHTLGKRAKVNSLPRVRIPPSPPVSRPATSTASPMFSPCFLCRNVPIGVTAGGRHRPLTAGANWGQHWGSHYQLPLGVAPMPLTDERSETRSRRKAVSPVRWRRFVSRNLRQPAANGGDSSIGSVGRKSGMSLGTFPDVSLDRRARKRDDARELLADGVDPSAHARPRKREAARRPSTVSKRSRASGTASRHTSGCRITHRTYCAGWNRTCSPRLARSRLPR